MTIKFLERKKHDYDQLKSEIERLESEVGSDKKDLFKRTKGSF